jgi:tetratricopeptide (TPR) repeat protein
MVETRHPDLDFAALQLWAGYAHALMHVSGPGPAAIEACGKALDIAVAIGNVSYQLRALLALWNGCFSNGETRKALDLAERFFQIAQSSGESDQLIGHRLMGTTELILGRPARAQRHLEAMLERYPRDAGNSDLAKYAFGQRASARGLLAATLMLQGLLDQAMAASKLCGEEALASGHAVTICGVIGTSCCTQALYIGDLQQAMEYTDILKDNAVTHGLSLWEQLAAGFEGVLMIRGGDLEGGLDRLHGVLSRHTDWSNTRYLMIYCEYALALGRAGAIGKALSIVDELLERSERNGELWYIPELLRTKGQLVLLNDRLDCNKREQLAAELYTRSLELADRQGALTWEIKTAISFSRLLMTQARHTESHNLIRHIYGKFTEGFNRSDLIEARSIMP